jgi:uncharacterized membrane protein
MGVRRSREENEVEFARIVAFSDGVFAIAITLLVLNLEIPKGLAEADVASALWDLHENFVAFGISFAVIGRFWVLHHRLFGDISGFDGRLLSLNLVYLGSIVLIPFSSQLLGEYGDASISVIFYSVNLALAILLGALMSLYAEQNGLTVEHQYDHGEARARSLYLALVFLGSIPIAFVSPGIAPFVWLLLFFDLPGLIRRRTGPR